MNLGRVISDWALNRRLVIVIPLDVGIVGWRGITGVGVIMPLLPNELLYWRTH